MKKRRERRRLALEEPVPSNLDSGGFGYQVPPGFDSVSIYFSQKGYAKIAGNFYQHFHNLGWLTKTGTSIKNWKVLATDWIFGYSQSVKLAQRKLENII
jgi:hypothetical protein